LYIALKFNKLKKQLEEIVITNKKKNIRSKIIFIFKMDISKILVR